jgi:membrane peptidoglycan carboxypeptidase
MPAPSLIVKFRLQRRDKQWGKPGSKLGLVLGILSSLLIMLGIFVGVAAYDYISSDLLSLEAIPAQLDPASGAWLQPTRLYDRSGEYVILTLQHPDAEGRRYLIVSTDGDQDGTFSENLVQATIATIDPTYWDNPGYSWQIIGDNGEKTLAQQLVDDLLLRNEAPSLRRNIRELLLARQLISRYGHIRVLEWYLNTTRYGAMIYGADAASLVYFGKSAAQLSLAEAAWLTAAGETPEIDPFAAPHVVRERQKQIIAEMLIQGYLTAEEASQATGQDLIFRTTTDRNGVFQVFANLALEQIGDALSTVPIERGGMRIVTTIDYDLQMQASCALESQLKRLGGDSGEVLTADGAPCEAARLIPTIPSQDNDLVPGAAASLVVLDPATSQVLAMVGQTQSGKNPAHLPGQPAGTLLSPFIYLSAFVRGFSPATLIWEVPQADQIPGNVLNSSGIEEQVEQELEYHGPVRLRTALANDYLAAAAQIFQRVGFENVWQTANQFGMISLGESVPATGTFEEFLDNEITLLESVHAYAVFNNLGIQTGQKLSPDGSNSPAENLSPIAVLRVENIGGEVLLDWSSTLDRPIVSPQLAYLVTDVLSDEVARWNSLGHPNPLEIGRPAGARLAASLDGSQSWTVGYIPQLVVGSWIGTLESEKQVIPRLTSAALWNAVIKYASQQLVVEDWEMPVGVSSVPVCDPSGLLPTQACPAVVDEVFLAGSEPGQTDNLYQVLRINHETGRLATVFTPSELVEDKVFLVVPDWAEQWAKGAGLPVPPQGYDPIYLTQQGSADVQLVAPAMFSHVRGVVELRGSAAGGNFKYYRIQVGQGLYPDEWLLVGEDQLQPVTDGKLGDWDTRGLQGLYVVQLSVVHADQRVERVILQVTVDNTPPEITIMDPTAGEHFLRDAGDSLLLQASARDDLVLARLEFYLDDELYLTLWQPPYACMWPAAPGEHTLLVRAYDLAGNSSEQMVVFEVQH